MHKHRGIIVYYMYSQRQLGGDVKGLLIKDARIVPNFGINVLGENVFLDKGATVIKRPDP